MFKYVYNTTKTGKDNFIYCECEIKGHAENEDARVKLQVCSGVSAIVNGFYRLVDDMQYEYEYGKGYFHIRSRHSIKTTGKYSKVNYHIDRDTNYGLNTMVCQLYELYLTYPQHFSKFDLIELKEYVSQDYDREKDNEQCKFSNAKQRKQYREKVGFHSSEEN